MEGKNFGFENWHGNYGRGFMGEHANYGCRRGLRRRSMMRNESLTGLDYDLLYTLSDGEKDAATLLEDISAFRGNKNFPVLGCINLHLKELSELGYVEQVEREGKRYYRLTENGKKLVEDN